MNNFDLLENYPKPSGFSGYLLWQSANKWEKVANAVLQPIGLNQNEYFHLISLIEIIFEGDEVTQIDLANFVGSTAMNTSKVIRKLEKLKIVTRKEGRDSRSKKLDITELGKSIAIKVAKDLGQAQDSFFPKEGSVEFIKYLQNIT